MSRILLTSFLVFVWNPINHGFNIDTQNIKVFSGVSGTHFGYTMRFDNKAVKEGHINLLIGAPETKRLLWEDDKQEETGGLITCYDVLGDVQTCREEKMDNVFPTFIQGTQKKSHIEGGYGYGLSVSEDGTRLVCAPFWKDVKYTIEYKITFMPGRCTAYIEKQGSTEIKYVMPYYKGLPYVVHQNLFAGTANFGLSSDIYQNSVFAVGVPGLTISEGGVTIIDYRSEPSKVFSSTIQYRNTLGTTAYGYLGYQVKFGQFCAYPSICFAAGAPNLDFVGVVRLYRWANEEFLVNFQTIKGEEPWSYFGSVLCGADIDGDAMDELLVGAPFYHTRSHRGYDIGKVYVYKRETVSKYFHLLQKITGPGAAWSRFGAAIERIGDINLDKHSDLAIGAPGEEEGKGCIYIYLGHHAGGMTFSQRICASQIPGLKPPIKGFGSTISDATKSMTSRYPIFAVGIFQSDKIVLLRSRPILEVTATLMVNPNPIDIDEPCKLFRSDEPCAVVGISIKHNIKESSLEEAMQPKQRFSIKLKIDGKVKSTLMRRAAFVTTDGQRVDHLETSRPVRAEGEFFDFQVVIKKGQLERDRFTPIQVEFTYDLQGDSQDFSTPIMDPLTDNTLRRMISFVNDCGSDNICYVDLKASQRLIYPTDNDGDAAYITFGHTKEITILVTVSNNNESCYWTQIEVKLDQPLSLRRFNSDTVRQCEPVSDVLLPRGTTIVCNYYQPLATGEVIGVTLTFEADGLASDRESLTISTEAKSKDHLYNPEIQPKDNKVKQATLVYIVSYANILGNAIPSEIKINKGKKISSDINEPVQDASAQNYDSAKTITLNHKILIKNKGPSFLPMTNLTLSVPAFIPDGTLLVIGTTVKLVADKQVIDCSKAVSGPVNMLHQPTASTLTSAPPDSGVVTLDNVTFIPPVGRVRREANEESGATENDDDDDDDNDNDDKEATIFTLSCDRTPEYCLSFSCGLPKVIPSGGHAELNVTLTLDEDNIPLPETYSSFRLELKTMMEEPNHKLLKPWNALDMEQVMAVTHTTFHLYQDGGTVNPWVIAGSVAAGLLLIIIIALICWKLGFFERKRHFQVQKWKRESIKSKRASQKSKRESQNHED